MYRIINKIDVYRSELKKNSHTALKNLSTKRRLLSALFAISLAMFAVSYLEKAPITKVSLQNLNQIKTIKTTSNLESQFKYVERFSVDNPKGTVIYIPQIHKEPTTSIDDPKNDRAEIIQKEMYSILNELVNENGVKLVMDETDLYGPIPKDKVAEMKKTIEGRNAYKEKLDRTLDEYLTAGGSQEIANKIKKQSDEKLASIDRNLFLTGSAAVLEATNPNAIVYGSQNKETIDEARRQLQNIVFMENRIAQLEGTTNSSSQSSTITQKEQIKRLLSQIGGNKSAVNIFSPIKTLANKTNNESLNKTAAELEKDLAELVNKTNYETKTTSGATPVKNPYANVTNLSRLKNDYNEAYDKFMLLAKDKRSQEVAENTIRMIQENEENNGILVLGAQHKDQLIEVFNNKGYSVTVITPESELNQNS